MGNSRTGKASTLCSACGHACGIHSNEACEAIRCACRVTQKQLASGTGSSSPVAMNATTVLPAYAADPIRATPVIEGERPARQRRKRSGDSHAA